MAINEDVCWTILQRALGNSPTITLSLKSKDYSKTLSNGMLISEIEKELVLQYSKSEIEDSLYFLEKREYICVEGFGVLAPRCAYSLTEAGKSAIDNGAFTLKEQRAFADALFELGKPGWFGMKFNVSELRRRFGKFKNRKRPTEKFD